MSIKPSKKIITLSGLILTFVCQCTKRLKPLTARVTTMLAFLVRTIKVSMLVRRPFQARPTIHRIALNILLLKIKIETLSAYS